MLYRLTPLQIPLAKNADAKTQGLPKRSVLQILSNWVGHQLDMRDLRGLLAMNEQMLSDIGLTRSDLLAEYRRLSTMSWTTRAGHARLRLNELRRDTSPVSTADRAGQNIPVSPVSAAMEAIYMVQRYRR
jgi:uncharacterized protein YjiS (DUF1127 family)